MLIPKPTITTCRSAAVRGPEADCTLSSDVLRVVPKPSPFQVHKIPLSSKLALNLHKPLQTRLLPSPDANLVP